MVNKYIGETEKNLRKIFDAAEASDSVLFFDEADALFGKRTEVKDAHDRFANIEISYLLERMERFKGLAILATNRRKDLDEAFMRRLRYVVEFPLPGAAERERIWRQVFPAGVDAARSTSPSSARSSSWPAGTSARSRSMPACRAPANGGEPRLAMADVLIAIRHELDKLDRLAAPEQFGRYADLVRDRMSEARIDIDRIAVTLYGVSPTEAQGTATALAALLRQRLAGWRPDIAGAAPVDLGTIDLGSVDIGARLDGPALTALLADRLIAQLDRALAAPSASPGSV